MGHLAALWALAFAQPLFNLLGENPEFFVARGNTAGQIIAFSLIFVLVPPLVALALEAAAGAIDPLARWGLHLCLFALLLTCLFVQALKGMIDGPAGVLIAIAAVVAVALTFAYARWRFPRVLMDVLTVAPVVVLAIFLLTSQTSRLILPREDPQPIHVAVNRPAPVVLIVFDEFPVGSLMKPDGRIDASRYPAFAELARTSTWYRNESASAAYTSIAVPAIFSGHTPDRDALPVASDYPHSLFTLLGGSYRMRVMESATQICPTDLCPDPDLGPQGSATLGDLFSDLKVVSEKLLLPESMARGLPDTSTTFGNFTNQTGGGATAPATGATGESGGAGRTGRGQGRELARAIAAHDNQDEGDRVTEFNSWVKPGHARTLYVVHIEKPHYPWKHLPDGRRYTNLTSEWGPLLPNDGPWLTSDRVINTALQRHLLEVGWTDTLLGRMIDRLKEEGVWDGAVVAVTADHGGAFIRNKPRREPDAANLGEVGMVPLFIKAPHQSRGRIVTRHTCNSDILPRVSRLLGIRYPWPVEPCPPHRVSVISAPVGGASTPLAAAEAGRQRYQDRIAKVFGEDGWGPVFRFGPNPGLIGTPLSKLRLLPLNHGPKQRAYPARPNLVTDFDPRSPTPLALLQRGSFKNVTRDKRIAVAINGRIAALGWSFKYGDGGGYAYSILLPPGTLKRGDNVMRIYMLQGRGKKLALRTIYRPPPGGEGGDGA